MYYKLIIALVIIWVPIFLKAQYTLEGQIFDATTQQMLPSAHIQLNETFRLAVSDYKGQFKIDNLRPQTYQLTITYMGFETYQTEVKLDKNQKLDIKLKPASIMQSGVLITKEKANQLNGTTYSNVYGADLKKVDLGQDLPLLLNNTPSIVTTSDAGNGVGYTGMRIRGTDITRINVTLNGIPMNDAESQGVWWVNTPDLTSSLNSIQIQRGIGTSSNGAAAFGASINMSSGSLLSTPYAEVNASVGSFNTQRYRFETATGLIDNKWSFEGRISKMYSDGYIDRAFADLKSYYASGAFYGKNSILKLLVFGGKEKTYQAWNGMPKDSAYSGSTYNSYTYENETDNYQQTHIQLIYLQNINSHWAMNWALHYTKGAGYYESFNENGNFSAYGIPPFVLNTDTIQSCDFVQQKWLDNDFYGATFNLDYNPKTNFKVSLGGAFNQYLGNHFGEVIWSEFAYMGKDYEWYRNKGTKNTFNAFTKITYLASKKLSLYADLQYRMIDYSMNGLHDDFKDLTANYNFSFFNPKIGLNYNLNSSNQFYFSIANAQKEPSRNDFRDADFGKTPKVEHLTDLELGYGYQSQNFSLGANAFYMGYKDQLIMTGKVNNVGAPIMTNVENSFRTGIETYSALKLTPWFTWSANLSLSANKIKNFTEYVDNWDTWIQDSTYKGTTDIAFSPAVVAFNQFQIKPLNSIEILINTKYVGKQYIDNSSNNLNALKAYTTTDLIIIYSPKIKSLKNLSFSLAINNAFNEKYASNAWVYSFNTIDPASNQTVRGTMDGYFPQASTNLLFSVNIRF